MGFQEGRDTREGASRNGWLPAAYLWKSLESTQAASKGLTATLSSPVQGELHFCFPELGPATLCPTVPVWGEPPAHGQGWRMG